MNRRRFLATSSAAGLSFAPAAAFAHPVRRKDVLFDISLAEWSLHRTLRSGSMTNLDFPRVSKETFGIDAVEYVNQFFKDKARDTAYLDDPKKRCDDLGVQSLLIMIDGEGHLGHGDPKELQKTIENHKKWVEAAAHLGCHSIRVNAHGHGDTDEEKAANTVKGLRRLSRFAAGHGISIIVENHGGLSSNGKWLAGVLAKVGMVNCGSLPDFGNFTIDRKTGEQYDRYRGIRELMPFAKGVSAKSKDFDAEGNDTQTDFGKALKLVLDAGYRGHIGIEYEGKALPEEEGIKATKKLLEKLRAQLAKKYS